MKRKSLLFLLLIALFAPLAMNGQGTITIGTGTNTQNASPMNHYWNYSLTEMIYTSAEIADQNPVSNTITHVGFQLVNSFNGKTYTIAIYMKNIDDDSFSSASWESLSASDQVFSGTVTASSSGWVTLQLSSPFSYDNTKNLLIGVNKTAGGYAGSSYTWYYTTTSAYQHLEKHNDDNAYSITSMPSSPTRDYKRPNVQLTFRPTTPYITLDPESATVITGSTQTLTATYGNVTGTPTITYTSSNTNVATVSGNGTTATVTGVSAGTATITATMNGSYTATCAITVEDPSYCTPGTGNYDGNGISNVSFGTNPSVNNTVGGIAYGDYSNLVGAVSAGATCQVDITYKTGYTYGTIIWVDWNHNYIFEGTEAVYAGQSGDANPTTLNATFTVPAATSAGDYRMRIIGSDSGLDSYTGSLSAAANADPCGSYSYSTCHDYTLRVSSNPFIALSPTSATVFTGFTQALTASYGNVSGTPTITYSSSNTNVATVSGSGTSATVTGVAPGTATITATMNGSYTATCTVTVEDPSYCTPGTGNYDNDGIYNVTFGTNGVVVNNTVSGINYGDYSNMVGAVEAGTTGFEVAITYKTGYTYGTIIWVDWNKNYTFEGATEVVYVGQSGDSNPTTLTATFDIPSTTAAGDYRMRIIGSDMALDSYTGSISAAASVDACGSYNYSTCHDYTLRVFAASTDPSITLSPATATVLLDETATLTAVVRNATSPTITWTSSDTSVATVSGNGTTATVTGVAVGTATITASMTVNGTPYTSTSTITVQLDPCTKVIPYTYGFEDATDFSCWTTENCEECSNNSSLYGRYSSSSYARTGSYSFVFSSYCGETDPQYLISPKLSGVANGVHVEFYYKIVDFTDAPETFEVGYSTTDNNVSSFTWVDSYTTNSQTYEHFSANYMGNVKYIAVKYTSADSYYIIVDDFTIEEAPSCLEPTNVLASDETTTSATISWTAGGSETEWDIYFTTNSSDVPTASTTPTFSGLTTNSFNTVTNNYTLTPATIYYVYVRAVCSGTETSGWSNPGIFNTECYEMNLPFSYGFEDGGLSVCWTAINESPVYMSVSVASDNAYEGTYHLFLDRRTTQSSNQIVVLPEVSSNYALSNCEVSFYAMLDGGSNYYNYGRTLTVGVMTDPDDVSTFVAVGSAVEPGTSYAQYTFDLSSYTGNGQYIAIKHDATSNGYTYIDNIEVTVNVYTKTIQAVGAEAWAEGKGGYYLIASPLAAAVDPTTITDMIPSSGNYDLYAFNQEEANEWRNYKDSNFNLVNGKGYLYANKNGVTLTFVGPAGTNGTVTLDKTNDASVDFQGWNLIGNPLGEDAYITKSCYTLENSDSYTVNAAGTAIHAMQGLLVVADSDGETLTFSTTAPSKKAATLNMNVSMNRSVIDQAIISFSEGQQLPKLQFRQNSTKVYMPKEGIDYAIVSAESNVGEMPVNFKAEDNGTYTLSFTTEEVRFAYLHLIDNMTGNDVDLLATPSYTFDAKSTDYESRFKLVFATGNNSNDDTFAFFSNGAWIINNDGEATLQVVDVTGRIISSETVSGSCSKAINAAQGVYMLRLINGNDVKVQKIVVR